MKAGHATLSTEWEAELGRIECWCEHELRAIRAINDRCLQRMDAPADFLEALPRHIKALGLGEHTRRVLEGHDAADDAHHKRLRRETRVTEGYGGLQRATRVTAKGGHEALEKGVMAPN